MLRLAVLAVLLVPLVGEPASIPPPARLDLVCARYGGGVYDFVGDATGAPTAEQAARAFILDYPTDDMSFHIRPEEVVDMVRVPGRNAYLFGSDGIYVLRAYVDQLPDGTWIVLRIDACVLREPGVG
jgi:hypothetical protein